MAQIKNSLAGEGPPIAFEINENSTVRWIGKYDITIDEILNGDESKSDGSKLADAVDGLKQLLNDGDVPCVEIYTALQDKGIGKRSIDRAKKQLGIKSIKHSDGWHWSLLEDRL